MPKPLRPRPREDQQQPGQRKKHWKTGGDGKSKWFSPHKTTSHSDEQCLKQKATKKEKASSIEFPNIGSARISRTAEPEQSTFAFSFTFVRTTLAKGAKEFQIPAEPDQPAVVLGSSPEERLERRTANILGLFGALGEVSDGESYSVTSPDLSSVEKNGNGINNTSLMMLVDSGAPGYYLDTELAPGIQRRMTNHVEHQVVSQDDRHWKTRRERRPDRRHFWYRHRLGQRETPDCILGHYRAWCRTASILCSCGIEHGSSYHFDSI